MKVLISDKLEESVVRQLTDAGFDVSMNAALTGDELRQAVGEKQPNVLVVRSTKVPAEVMDASRQLELIVRAGAGYDTIDVPAASDRGIFVSNCPGKNAVAVAELTLGLILALDRKIADNVIEARSGRWNKAAFSKADGIKGKTLGIIGLGNIGREVAIRAKAFDLNVMAWSRSLTRDKASELGVTFADTPLVVAAHSDIVSFHVAATPDTKALADRPFFQEMKDGAFFINTTRSSVVDEDALKWALENKGIYAGLDVFASEPAAKHGEFESDLAQHPNVYLTHHIGASTAQAQQAIADEALRVVRVYAEKGEVENCVNMAQHTPATHQITVRHRDKVGVLAAILDECRAAGWNVQEMENLVFEGARAACAHIRFDGHPDPAVVDRISGNEDVLAVSLIEL
ncbi:MAG: hydroxyacid dehydrogenase [Rhodothermia bacterium]|nr:hydroxyacid dehydrogenase [Rhodothermia bacterium]